jgi:hypothetical protein
MQSRHSGHKPTQTDFHGAALVDAQGREIPITDDMIKQACESLERRWHYPSRPSQQGG